MAITELLKLRKYASACTVEKYVDCLSRHGTKFIAMFILSFIIGLVLAPVALGAMTTHVSTTAGTYSRHAHQIFQKYFPDQERQEIAVVILRDKNDSAVLGSDGTGSAVKNITQNVVSGLQHLTYTGLVHHIDSWYTFRSYPDVQKTFVSDDGSVTFIAVSYDMVNDHGQVISVLQDVVNSVSIVGHVEASLTGAGPIASAATAGVIENLKLMDTLTVPVALMVFSAALRNCRLVLLPVIAIVTASVWAILFICPIALRYPVFIISASLMMTLTIAMGIDYSLFLLSRLEKEKKTYKWTSNHAKDCKLLVTQMLRTAGHTVLVSGSILALTFLCLIFAHDFFTVSMGVGSAIATVSAMMVALLVLPVLLLTFPHTFGCVCQETKQSSVDAPDLIVNLPLTTDVEGSEARSIKKDIESCEAEQSYAGHATEDELDKEIAVLTSTNWYRFASWILEHKACMIIVVSLCFMPALINLPRINISSSPMFFVPHGSEAFKGLSCLNEKFGAGIVWPTHVIVVPPSGSTVLSHEVFNRVSAALEDLKPRLPAKPSYTMQSMVYDSRVGKIPFSLVNAALHPSELTSFVLCNATNPAACELLRVARERWVNQEATAMLVNFNLHGDPFDQATGVAWLKALRVALDTLGPEKYTVLSSPSSVSDTVTSVYDSAPFVFTITAALLFAIIAAGFRSIMIPLRLLPSIGLTLAWTYGVAVLVYQDGWLAWTNVGSLTPIPGGIAPGVTWVVPMICISILTGLCLDYDIFALGRIAEFRRAGFSDHDAIILGISASGSVITTAGGIMVIAFSGLLMTRQMVLNQLAFFLVVCVLIDTWIVRTIVVPVCMDILGNLSNWWPGEMPPPTRTIKKIVELTELSPIDFTSLD